MIASTERYVFFSKLFFVLYRIESEDQLDSAKRPGDEKQTDDKEDADCKEEQGIDMSEDFDSKLQVKKESDTIKTIINVRFIECRTLKNEVKIPITVTNRTMTMKRLTSKWVKQKKEQKSKFNLNRCSFSHN